jgi:hypothetical protein
MRPGFRACFEDLLNRTHLPLDGTMRLAMHVDCTGRVVEIGALVTGLDQDAVTCVFRTAASGHFDPPEGGASVVNVPVKYVYVPR